MKEAIEADLPDAAGGPPEAMSMPTATYRLQFRNGMDFDKAVAIVPYLKDLGITYVHFMPCLMPRPGDSDGGYSVMDYRKINPAFGTMKEFEAVCREFREAGVSVCVDMVLNHTAKEHAWARKARIESSTRRVKGSPAAAASSTSSLACFSAARISAGSGLNSTPCSVRNCSRAC